MKTVFLLDSEEKQVVKIAEFLNATREYRVVGHAQSGEEGLTKIRLVRPDVVILDVVLQDLDGFAVMDAVKDENLPCKIMVASAFGAESVVTNAIRRGAEYFLLKPFRAEVLKSRLDGLFTAKTERMPEDDVRRLDERISNIFITVGIPPHIKGYGYLREGVKMAIRSPEIINRITKELYPKIGEKFDTSASKVERAIRHAIEVAWNRGRIETINSLFGVRAYVGGEKPTNGEFIALVADKMLLEGA